MSNLKKVRSNDRKLEGRLKSWRKGSGACPGSTCLPPICKVNAFLCRIFLDGPLSPSCSQLQVQCMTVQGHTVLQRTEKYPVNTYCTTTTCQGEIRLWNTETSQSKVWRALTKRKLRRTLKQHHFSWPFQTRSETGMVNSIFRGSEAQGLSNWSKSTSQGLTSAQILPWLPAKYALFRIWICRCD